RDQIRSLEKIREKQKVISTRPVDQDVIAFALGPDNACSQIFFIRKGKLIGGEHFFLRGIRNKSQEKILTSLVKQYYYNATYIPKAVVLQNEIEEKKLIKDYLERKGKRKVRFIVPRKGDKLKLIKLAKRNARLALTQQYSASQQMKQEALGELQRTLGLKELPFKIEAFDISNISGTLAAGSLVVFKGGEPDKNEYRRFRIKRSKKADDYAMMAEVVERRYKRLLKERKIMPDLILVDGGKGQLSAALKVLKRLKIKLPVAALAKEYEHLFIPGKSLPIMLAKNSSALYLLKQIRDEAHRFALAYHRKLRKKKIIHD
ncbi:excinuclease ABC subunit C, partial [bacterium]|nr:excinuclease ABC subunit C [bacterium]